MIKMVNGRKRIFYLDQLRALAIILVILAHVCRQFSYTCPIGSLKWGASAFFIDFAVMGVPIFLMISGSLLLNREYELPDFLKRRFSRILIPFIFWALILPIFRMFLGDINTGVSVYIKTFLTQYWFVWMLIGVYLILPIVNSFINKYGIKGAEYFLVIWFICILLNSFGYYPFYKLELSYFAGYLGYLVLGYWLVNKEFKFSDRKMIWIGLLIFLVCLALNMRCTWVESPIKDHIFYYQYLTIVTVLQSAGLFLVFEYFAKYCSNNENTVKNKIYSLFKDTFLSKIILSISVCSYGMYLIHYFPLFTLKYVNKNIVPIFSNNPVIWLPMVLGAIVISVWILTYVLSKIPYLRNISGAH